MWRIGVVVCLGLMFVVLVALLLLPHLPQASVTGTPSLTSLNGVYFPLPKGDDIDTSRAAVTALQDPYVDGIYIRDQWSDLEPASGSYTWSYLDTEIREAEALGKKVAIGIDAGSSSPAWIYLPQTGQASGAQAFYSNDIVHGAKNHCDYSKMPVPYDPVYLSDWLRFVQALGARYASDPHITEVKITGMNDFTDETRLPYGTNNGINIRFGCFSVTVPGSTTETEVEEWVQDGYTGQKVFDAWKQIAAAFATAFPNQYLTIMTSTQSFPPIGMDGSVATSAAASSTDSAFSINYLLPYGADTFGKRFVAAENGWRDNHIDQGVWNFGTTTGNLIGWQQGWTFTSGETGYCYPNGPSDIKIPFGKVYQGTTCNLPEMVRESFALATKSNSSYLEVFGNILSSTTLYAYVEQAHTRMTEAGK